MKVFPFVTLPSLDNPDGASEGATTEVDVNIGHIVLYSKSVSKVGCCVVLLSSGNSLYTPKTSEEVRRLINHAQERASE